MFGLFDERESLMGDRIMPREGPHVKVSLGTLWISLCVSRCRSECASHIPPFAPRVILVYKDFNFLA